MSPELAQILLTVALLTITVLLPLLPTIVIYRLFPSTDVIVSGPFKGLTVRAAGAFGAYFVTFLAATPFAWLTFNLVTSMITPTWTITGNLMLVDPEGRPIRAPELFSKVNASLVPATYSAANGKLWIKVPEMEHTIPAISLDLPTFGSVWVDVSDSANNTLRINRINSKRTIHIDSPIVIRQSAAATKAYMTDAIASPAMPLPGPPPPPSVN